jgi:hypothetical protein
LNLIYKDPFYLGLYTTTNSPVRRLVRSVRKVAAGAYYNEPISTQTKYELSSIASVMDAMRLRIQEREDS